MNLKNTDKLVRIATIGIVVYLLCFGIAMAFFPIRPFWNDEWRLTYNLKFKDVHQLWGTLDLLQECPRCFLTLLKWFTAYFDYSYVSLRVPALIITFINIFFVFRLKKKIFPGKTVYGYLFLLILISSQTFTDYIVQIKQYELDIFLCLLALWQLITLLNISRKGLNSRYQYVLLCFSFLAAPYFSYMYPIAIVPVYLLVFLDSVITVKGVQRHASRLALFFPLMLAAVSIIIFYLIDVRHMMADSNMYASYLHMLGNDKNESRFISDFWYLFALVGSGFVFEIVFGIVGISAFFYGIYQVAKAKMRSYTNEDYLKLYAVILLFITLAFFLSGKIVGGVARLTVFDVPSISLLIAWMLRDLKIERHYTKVANITLGILFLGLYGNVISTCINRFTYREYNERIRTFWHTGEALKQARIDKLPLLYTDGVRGDIVKDTTTGPGKIDSNMITPEQIRGVDRLCTEVILKDHPEYKVWDTIPVYMIPDMKWVKEYMQQLPPKYNSAIAFAGMHFIKVYR